MMSKKVVVSNDSARRHHTFYSCSLSTLVLFIIIAQLIQQSDAQAYHFSKGWMPGRKRAVTGAGVTVNTVPSSLALIEAVRRAVYDSERVDLQQQQQQTSVNSVCSKKSRVYRLVIDMIREVFERLDETCDLLSPPQGNVASDSLTPDQSSYLQSNAGFDKQ